MSKKLLLSTCFVAAFGLFLLSCATDPGGREIVADDGMITYVPARADLPTEPGGGLTTAGHGSPMLNSVVHSLTTTFVDGNGYAGNTFDLEVLAPGGVRIIGFDMNLQNGAGTMSVYWKTGTAAGFEGDAGAWTLMGVANVTPVGADLPTPVDPGDLELPPGQYGFYVFSSYPDPRVRYTNGSATYSTPELVLTSGVGISVPLFGGSYNADRIWNGTIYYDVLPYMEIDIKPGSVVNPINPKSKGVIPVAILSSDVFDATQIDYQTIRFGPAGAEIAHKHPHLDDVNGDGIMDLMLHFRTQDTGIMSGDIEACLSAMLMDGTAVSACDAIVTVPMEGIAPVAPVN
jgi:hypothetical protein